MTAYPPHGETLDQYDVHTNEGNKSKITCSGFFGFFQCDRHNCCIFSHFYQ